MAAYMSQKFTLHCSFFYTREPTERLSNPYKNKPDRWPDSGFTAGEGKPTECKTKYWKDE